MHRSRTLKHTFSIARQAAATLTGFEPTSKVSRLCAILPQTCVTLRVRGEKANQAVCTNRAELRSSSVRFCPKLNRPFARCFLRLQIGLSRKRGDFDNGSLSAFLAALLATCNGESD